MADQPNAFEGNKQTTEAPTTESVENKGGNPSTQQPESDPFANQLTSITNEEGKPKYTSTEEALKALKHSQEYIPQLKTEVDSYKQKLAELQAELDKRSSVEDVVNRLTQQQEASNSTKDDQSQVSGLDEQSAKQLFERMLQETKQKESVESNKQTVNAKLYEKYGDKTPEIVQNKAQELGTTPEQLGDLASQNPSLVLALFQSQPDKGIKTTTSSVNLPSSRPAQEELSKPELSLLGGASSKQQAEYMRKIKQQVYDEFGVTG